MFLSILYTNARLSNHVDTRMGKRICRHSNCHSRHINRSRCIDSKLYNSHRYHRFRYRRRRYHHFRYLRHYRHRNYRHHQYYQNRSSHNLYLRLKNHYINLRKNHDKNHHRNHDRNLRKNQNHSIRNRFDRLKNPYRICHDSFLYLSYIMILRKLAIVILSYYISMYLIIDKRHYDINHYAIENFKQERYRCIRYISNNYINKKEDTGSAANIAKYISRYPYVKCRKYKNEYILYLIYKNKVIIYNTLIHIIFYINIIFL